MWRCMNSTPDKVQLSDILCTRNRCNHVYLTIHLILCVSLALANIYCTHFRCTVGELYKWFCTHTFSRADAKNRGSTRNTKPHKIIWIFNSNIGSLPPRHWSNEQPVVLWQQKQEKETKVIEISFHIFFLGKR